MGAPARVQAEPSTGLRPARCEALGGCGGAAPLRVSSKYPVPAPVLRGRGAEPLRRVAPCQSSERGVHATWRRAKSAHVARPIVDCGTLLGVRFEFKICRASSSVG